MKKNVRNEKTCCRTFRVGDDRAGRVLDGVRVEPHLRGRDHQEDDPDADLQRQVEPDERALRQLVGRHLVERQDVAAGGSQQPADDVTVHLVRAGDTLLVGRWR